MQLGSCMLQFPQWMLIVVNFVYLYPGSLIHSTAPDFQSYVSSLPYSARSHLELQLDWDHKGVETDLGEVAFHLVEWEEELLERLELTVIDAHDIKEIYIRRPVLQR